MSLLAVMAVVALATLPIAAFASGPSADPGLGLALAPPMEFGFTESPPGSTAHLLVGPFDAETFGNAYRYPNGPQVAIDYLTRHHFVGGYGRAWYREPGDDWLSEMVFQVATSDDATTLVADDRQVDPKLGSPAFVDATAIPGAFGRNEIAPDKFHWTEFEFARGDKVFTVSRGSQSQYRPDEALAQAKRQYEFNAARISTTPQAGATPQRVASVATGMASWSGDLIRLVLGLGGLLTVLVLAIVGILVRGSARRRPPLEDAP